MKIIKIISIVSFILFAALSCRHQPHKQVQEPDLGVVLSIPSEGVEIATPDSTWNIIVHANSHIPFNFFNRQFVATLTKWERGDRWEKTGTLEEWADHLKDRLKNTPGRRATNINTEKMILNGNVPAIANLHDGFNQGESTNAYFNEEIYFDHQAKRYSLFFDTGSNSQEIVTADDFRKNVDSLLQNLRLFPATEQGPSIRKLNWGVEFSFPNGAWTIHSKDQGMYFSQDIVRLVEPYGLQSLCQINVMQITAQDYKLAKEKGYLVGNIRRTPVRNREEITIGNGIPALTIFYEPAPKEPAQIYDIPPRQQIFFEHHQKYFVLGLQVKDETFYASLKNDVDFILKNIKVL